MSESNMRSVVDISLELSADYRHFTPESVPDVQLSYEIIKDYPGGAGQRVTAVHMRLHHGTHIDAPMHFVEGGAAINDLPLESFYGEMTVLDLTRAGWDEAIGPEDIERALGDRSPEGARLFLRTDWNHRYGSADYQEGSPYLSTAAVDWIASRKPALVSYDYSHVKDAPEADQRFYAVRTFLRNDVPTMGYVRNLDQLDKTRPAMVAAFPLAFQSVEASPVRAVVVQD